MQKLRKIYTKYEKFLKKLFRVSTKGDGDVYLLFNIPDREDLMLLTFFVAKMYLYIIGRSDSSSVTAEEMQELPLDKQRLKNDLTKFADSRERLIVYTLKGYSVNSTPEKLEEAILYLRQDLERRLFFMGYR